MLTASGVQTYPSEWLAFVCPDDNHKIGRQVHFMRMSRLRDEVFRKAELGHKLVFGSLPENPGPETGGGYPLDPLKFRSYSFSLEKYWNGETMGSLDSEQVVMSILGDNGYTNIIKVDFTPGIDIKALKHGEKRFEVKMRQEKHKDYYCVFIQTHEINPGKVFELKRK
jgi:hypothetical protein